MTPTWPRQGRWPAPALFLVLLLAVAGVEAAEQEARFVLKAQHRTTLSSQIAARIAELPFGPGERFEKGDVLVRFDCRIYRAERDKVAAKLTGARKKLASNRRLDKMGSVSKLELVKAQAEVDQAEAELRITRINVDRCTVEAPFDGRVVKLEAREHQSVKQQQDLLKIVDTKPPEAEIVVPGTWMTWLAPGQRLELRVDETGETVPARVKTLGAVVDPASQTATIRAVPRNPGAKLLPGMSGTALFPLP